MYRIMMMVLRLFLKVPYYLFQIWWYGKSSKKTYEEAYAVVKRATIAANRAGKVRIESFGLENIPKENGFIFFPNHQGLYDVLAFLESSPVPFAFVIKKEAQNVILLKQVMKALGSISMDRDDIRQSMEVIQQVTEEVKTGRNFLIFAEGTRSREGNNLLNLKGGSFKSAQKAKCPIVPCALIDAFKPFDEKSIKPLTVKIIYLPPIYYEEYKDMKTVQIAAEVKRRIEEAIVEHM
ncbi:1-acyl-sn-glycerol-3-phosphate acyltransferase [Kineothrix alysoides]|uniref:1-acyl-sn-glycerol-3-phosphate acyltransferase n=1 Tax=Kineothrix alysoides TaxID=1469948 RepID=A0A4R1QMV6_9FIRM|nr:lysophospholipid acyltransferase family protein [Kineothrix alysoides]TCL54293.1 1-acyl-sn-glycerol-3-phosphate acyltransferase [Kineothrix alysoides]